MKESKAEEEGGRGGGLNFPTKRSSGHKKLNPFFMTEPDFEAELAPVTAQRSGIRARASWLGAVTKQENVRSAPTRGKY